MRVSAGGQSSIRCEAPLRGSVLLSGGYTDARKIHPSSPASETASSPPSPEPSGQFHSLGGRNRDPEIRIPLEIHHQVSFTDKNPHGEVHLDAYRHGRIPPHPQSGVLDTDPSNLRANLDFHPLGDVRLIGDDVWLSQEARCGQDIASSELRQNTSETSPPASLLRRHRQSISSPFNPFPLELILSAEIVGLPAVQFLFSEGTLQRDGLIDLDRVIEKKLLTEIQCPAGLF